MNPVDIKIGEHYHYWTVLGISKKRSNRGEIYYKCKCSCGTVRNVKACHLKSGGSKSCGCYVKIKMSEINRIDISNQRFGSLIAKKRVKDKKTGHSNKWLCKCDCGNTVIVSTGTLRRGKHKSCGCMRKGANSHFWKGGRRKTNYGYILYHNPNHPNSNSLGYVFEHRLEMENKIGRFLLDTEEVHHKNGIRDDNNIDNLELWSKSHPKGQRVEDMIDFCYEYLLLYKPELLSNKKLKSNNRQNETESKKN